MVLPRYSTAPSRDVLRYEQARRALLDPLHRVVRRLQGPDGVVDVALLVPADDELALFDPQPCRDLRRAVEDLHFGISGAGVLPVPLAYQFQPQVAAEDEEAGRG